MDTPFLHHTPAGSAKRALVAHRAELRMKFTMGGNITADVNILATLPGQTTDDRGVVGWVAPLGLEFRTASWTPGVGRGLVRLIADVAEDLNDPGRDIGFVYHWDHDQFATLRYRLRAHAPDAWWVEASGRSTHGDEFALALPLVVVSVDIGATAARQREAEAVAQEFVQDGLSRLTRLVRSGGNIELVAALPLG
jgi:hypothetical protein